MRLRKIYLHSLVVLLTLLVQIKQQLKALATFYQNTYEGRNIWFGVREFAMGAALNGMALTWWCKSIWWNILRIL